MATVCDHCGKPWTPTTNKPRFFCDDECQQLADARERLGGPLRMRIRLADTEAEWDELEAQWSRVNAWLTATTADKS